MNPSGEPARPAGVSIQAGQDATFKNSTVVGGNYSHHQETRHIDNRQKNTRVKVGLGSLALLLALGGGGWGLSKAYSSVTSSDVFEEAGTKGAVGTLTQIKKAEQDSDADRWCTLSSSTSGAPCRSIMASSFSVVAADLRAQIQDVRIGSPSGAGNTVQIPISLPTGGGGPVMLQWNGKRWELNRTMYLLAINNGGIFMTAVANAHHCGSALGTLTSCR